MSPIVAITGGTGLVGSRLAKSLRELGWEVRIFSRSASQPERGVYSWNPDAGKIDLTGLEGVSAVVHLAGENIADGRWTAAKKERILKSRVTGTQVVAHAITRLNQKPAVVVSASAIGWYGNRESESLTEDSASGQGFLPDVCRQWEGAAKPIQEAGVRLVSLRIGVVISTQGGALAKMLFPFRMGGGGVVGTGRQYMSWIAIDELCRMIQFAITTESLRGPVNATAPEPCTNAEFTKALGKALNRPTIFPLPGFAARLLFGEMADDLLLGSTRVLPQRLTKAGFDFQDRDVETALGRVIAAKL